jgi:hypothetical protein
MPDAPKNPPPPQSPPPQPPARDLDLPPGGNARADAGPAPQPGMVGAHEVVAALRAAFPGRAPDGVPAPSPEIREGGLFRVRGRMVDADGKPIKDA